MRVPIQSLSHLLMLTTTTTTIATTISMIMTPTSAFQTGTTLPLKIERIPQSEIFHRLGLSTNPATATTTTTSSSNSNNNNYLLGNEHEVLCPISGVHQGILCSAFTTPSSSSSNNNNNNNSNNNYNSNNNNYNAETIANHPELITSVINAGSLAASIRNRGVDNDSSYYLPFVITLVESYLGESNIGGLSLEEFWNNGSNDYYCDDNNINNHNGRRSSSDSGVEVGDEHHQQQQHEFMLYACNTHMEYSNKPGTNGSGSGSGGSSATSDVYVLPPSYSSSSFDNNNSNNNKVWRFSIEYKVATINLNQIKSFTPQRPDVWLKDDYF